MPTDAAVKAEGTLIHVLWINAGLSCDGDSVALTAATQPSIEEIALGALPGLPANSHVTMAADRFRVRTEGRCPTTSLEWFWKADRGELEPFVLVVEKLNFQRAAARRGLLERVREQPRYRANR